MKPSKALSLGLRKPARKVLKQLVQRGPALARKLVARIPFSRYQSVVGKLVAGETITSWDRLRVVVDPSETGGFLMYFLGECRAPDPLEIHLGISLVRDYGPYVVDVGANAGLFSLAIASRCPNAQILMVEPDRRMAGRAQRNMSLNPALAERVRLAHAAAGDREGQAWFAPGSATGPEMGRVTHEEDTSQPGYYVPVRRLDNLCASRNFAPDVVKIDVEGFEDHVLAGMSGLFAQHCPKAVMVETHGFTHGDTSQAFTYSIYDVLARNYRQVLRRVEERWVSVSGGEQWRPREHLVGKEVR